ncbi:MAG: response regulator [Myxococcales bacterium]|nr:response regulator [Myxococcales bacterium]
MAHDFNNILSVISSYTEFALEELREGDPLRADLHEIAAAGQRAAALTRQLLAFSRQQVLEPKRLDLGELVAGVTKMLRRLIGEDVTLHVTVADGLFFTRVDPGQIEQVLMNLAVNARDAMPEGGELQLELQNCVLDPERARTVDLPPGSYVEMVVTDTGAGMTPAVQARIFEPFFTTKALGKGTGLGLSMVHGIVKQSGGGISVETAPGRGTAFHVYFPRDASVAIVAEAPASLQPVEPAGHGRILVVEDEAALRNVVMRMLRGCGYDVLVAASPGEALLICEEHGDTFDLLLTDVVMPGMSGRRLAERLHPLCPRARVMFMSGYTDEMIEHHGVLGNHFLRKPFDRATLVTKVRSVLEEPAPTS